MIADYYDGEGHPAGLEIPDMARCFGSLETLRQVVPEGIGPSVQGEFGVKT